MPELTLFTRRDRSEQIGRYTMVAASTAGPQPFLRDIHTLVSPRKMDQSSYVSDEGSPLERQQILVSYSEASLELTQSEGDISEDGNIFLNSRKMGKHLQEMGIYSQALQYYRAALQCKHRSIDTEPRSIQEAFADILFDIGNIHLVPGFEHRAKSMEAFHFCLDIRRTCLGSSHPAVASALCSLASIHSSFFEHQYALDLLIEAVSILLCSSVDYTSDLIEVWTAIGKVQEALGQTEESQSSFQEAEQLK